MKAFRKIVLKCNFKLTADLVMIIGALFFLANCNPPNNPPTPTAVKTIPATRTAFLPTSPPTPLPEPLPPTSPIPAEVTEPVKPTETPEPGPPPAPVRFAVIGDYGLAGEPARAVAELVTDWEPDFVITTGDNNYPNGSAETIDENIGQYYARYIFPYSGNFGPGADEQNRFFPSPGNHDWESPGLAPYLDYFELPGNERYYDFVWGPVHLFALNTDSREPDGVSAGSIQATWLQNGLSNAEQPWKIVYGHLSPYSSGPHGGIDWMNWPFQEWGATALLAAHDHVYERIIWNGFPFIINGLGGGARYQFDAIHSGSVIRYRDNFGAMLVTAGWDQIHFEFHTIDGQRIDSFSP